MKAYKDKTHLLPFYMRKKYAGKLGKYGVPFYIEKNRVYNSPNPFLPYPIRIERSNRFMSFNKLALSRVLYIIRAERWLKRADIAKIYEKKPRRKSNTRWWYMVAKTNNRYRVEKNKDLINDMREAFMSSLQLSAPQIYKYNQRKNRKKAIGFNLNVKKALFIKHILLQPTKSAKLGRYVLVDFKHSKLTIFKKTILSKKFIVSKKIKVVLRAIKERHTEIKVNERPYHTISRTGFIHTPGNLLPFFGSGL